MILSAVYAVGIALLVFAARIWPSPRAPSALTTIVGRIALEAEARGAEVTGSELVGLMPAGAAAAAAGAMLRIDGFDASRVLELRLLDR